MVVSTTDVVKWQVVGNTRNTNATWLGYDNANGYNLYTANLVAGYNLYM